MTKKEIFLKKLKECGDVRTAAKEANLDESSAYRYVRQARGVSNTKTPPMPQKNQIRKIALTKLIDEERLDIKKVIHEGIKLLGARAVAYDDSFRRDLQITQDRWREYSRDPEFEMYRAQLPNRKVVWGWEETINELKKMDGVI
jgi:hypothetical protein